MPLGDMKVRKMREGTKSWFEPPYDPEWSELTKLKYMAACAKERDGVDITVRLGYATVNGIEELGVYSLSLPGMGMSPMDYRTCSDYIQGISIGYASRVYQEAEEQRNTVYELFRQKVEEDGNPNRTE